MSRRLYVPNVETWEPYVSKKYFSDRILEVKAINNGIILPIKPKDANELYNCRGGVCNQNFKFIAGFGNRAPSKGNLRVDSSYKVDRKELEHLDEEVIFGGAAICHFGHFLFECMSRMWYVAEHPEDNRRVVFEHMGQWGFRSWIHSILDLFGLPRERFIWLEKPTQFRSVIVPDQSVHILSNFTRQFREPFEQMIKNVGAPEGSVGKIFLSRSTSLDSARRFYNTEYFEEFYRARGYQVVYPEHMTFAEQVKLISRAEEVVTFHGTLSHWAMFCKPGTRFTILNCIEDSSVSQTIERQSLINEASGVDWQFVSVARNPVRVFHTSGPSLIGCTKYWRQYVRDRFDIVLEDVKPSAAVVSAYFDNWNRFKYFSDDRDFQMRSTSFKYLYNRMQALELQCRIGRPTLCYEVHAALKGWMPMNIEDDIAGTLDAKKALQAIRIYFAESFQLVSYSVYYPDEGWTESVVDGQMAGTTGKGRAIHGLSITLEATNLSLIYRVHGVNGIWTPWGRNGSKIASDKHAIDGVQIKILS